MGWGSIKKAVKKAGKSVGSAAEKTYKEYDRYTSSKLGAYATPYLSMYDSDGRDQLMKNYGGYATMGASAYNPAAGAAVGAVVQGYTAYNAPRPTAGASAFGAPAQQMAADSSASDDSNMLWIIGGIAGAALLAVVVAVALKKKA